MVSHHLFSLYSVLEKATVVDLVVAAAIDTIMILDTVIRLFLPNIPSYQSYVLYTCMQLWRWLWVVEQLGLRVPHLDASPCLVCPFLQIPK